MHVRSMIGPGIAALVAALAVGCNVEPPYVSGTETTPFTVELTAEAPVATRDVVLTETRGDGTANAALLLHDVDPRVRVAATGNADMDNDRHVDGLATFLHPHDGEIGLPLRSNFDCLEPPCGVQRLIFELTSPAPGEHLTVGGEVSVTYGYQGSTPRPGPAMTLEGFDAGASRSAGVERTTRVTVAPTTLDHDHPVAIQPVTFHLRTDPAADPLDVVSEVRVLPADVAGAAGYTFSMESPDPTRPAHVPVAMQGAPGTFAGAMGCDVPAADCQTNRQIRIAWDGTVPSVAVGYELESMAVTYADDPVDAPAEVTAELGDPATVPADAPRASATTDGTMVLDGGSDARAYVTLRLALDGFPGSPDPALTEVPGTVVLTYSAVARDGPAPSDGPPVRIGGSAYTQGGTGRTSAPTIEFSPDGQVRTATYGLLTACIAGKPCQVDVEIGLFKPQDGEPRLPVTLTYRVDVQVTSFSATPFPPGATVTIGPKPSATASPTTPIPEPSALAVPTR